MGDGIFHFDEAVRHDIAVEQWFDVRGELGTVARDRFQSMRDCGSDVRELLHDGHPTACVGDAAFAYVNAFTEHVNVGFFRGSELDDPDSILEGSGKLMRHVKVRPNESGKHEALHAMIEQAYADMKKRLEPK